MSYQNFLTAIDENLPDDNSQLIYIYHKLGKILFQENWSQCAFSFLQEKDANEFPILNGMVLTSKRIFPKKHNDTINYIFSKTLNKLT